MKTFLFEKCFEIKYRTKKTLPPIIPKIEALLLLIIRIGINKSISKEKIYFLLYIFSEKKGNRHTNNVIKFTTPLNLRTSPTFIPVSSKKYSGELSYK